MVMTGETREMQESAAPAKVPKASMRALRKGRLCRTTEELTTKTTVKVVFSYPFFDERSKKQWNFSKACLKKAH